jgi:hypothetical protein
MDKNGIIFKPLPLEANIQFIFKTMTMSAIIQLKNFVTAITRKLFTSSKNNGLKMNTRTENEDINLPQKDGAVRIINVKRIPHQASQELSEFTIF